MENKALLWFKPEKIGWLLLRQGNLDARQWRKLHCMIKGNNLYYILKLNRPEPTGVLPLEGCVAELARHDNDEPNKNCFIIIMKKYINEKNVHIHKNYLFAAESMADCQDWVDAVNIAAISTHIIRLKLEHAQREMEDLKVRWANAEDRDAGKEVDSILLPGEEDPIVLQALADELMELYHSTKNAEHSKIVAHKRLTTSHSHIAELRDATTMLKEQIQEQYKQLISKDINNAQNYLKQLLPIRYSMRDMAREIEVLDGSQEYGPEVAVMAVCESTLQSTLNKITKLREKRATSTRKSKLPDEGELWELHEQLNTTYEAEHALLQRALPKVNVELVAPQGRHRLSSSYAPELIIQSKTIGKQNAIDENTHGWSFNNPLAGLNFDFHMNNMDNGKKPMVNAQNNIMDTKIGNGIKESGHQNFLQKKSMLLQGINRSIVDNTLLKNEKDVDVSEEKMDVGEKSNKVMDSTHINKDDIDEGQDKWDEQLENNALEVEHDTALSPETELELMQETELDKPTELSPITRDLPEEITLWLDLQGLDKSVTEDTLLKNEKDVELNEEMMDLGKESERMDSTHINKDNANFIGEEQDKWDTQLRENNPLEVEHDNSVSPKIELELQPETKMDKTVESSHMIIDVQK